MKNSGLAVASLVLGLVGIVFDFIPGVSFIGLIAAIVGLILGIVAKNQIKNSNGQIGGGGMATAGIVLAIIVLALFVLGMLACAAFLGSLGTLGM
jgi:hypothetical protein